MRCDVLERAVLLIGHTPHQEIRLGERSWLDLDALFVRIGVDDLDDGRIKPAPDIDAIHILGILDDNVQGGDLPFAHLQQDRFGPNERAGFIERCCRTKADPNETQHHQAGGKRTAAPRICTT